MSKVTLVGKLNADVGEEFVFEGTQQRCEACSLKRTCAGLKAGRRYRVVELRGGRVQKCPIHEGGVKAVEVEETAIEAAVPSRKAIRGAKVSVKAPKRCPDDCATWTACHPEGVDGEKLVVEDIIDGASIDCPLDLDLKLVKMKG